jgi:hypothetical protein
MIDGMSVARISRVRGGLRTMRDGSGLSRSGPGRIPSTAGGCAGGGREAREAREVILRAMGDA